MELIGYCKSCNKELYCQNGFFVGVIHDDQTISCTSCSEKAAADAHTQENGGKPRTS
ncbi:hypothetical protein KDJ56_15015 [Brevibacillus composti]|uniref:Uncharacterized protein n=1 Tax=Brevibacillus composti TaxID=2796470 RepID=A0A7T5EIK4_9BACL|nr:hypothetical protein [Brevibacillus composti]QQE73220.1 hypothetical protein JD108_15070 [Brevibacillus composti]QUO40301.1 hypothetical protein KDJ56_15015 [Brevibacillus composti]